MNDTFGSYINRIRHGRKYHGSHVAKQAGISGVYLLEIEKGNKIPSTKVLLSLVDVLGITVTSARNKFFDLAALEKGVIPADVETKVLNNPHLIQKLRDYNLDVSI